MQTIPQTATDSAWWRAYTLDERRERGAPATHDPARAERRLSMWHEERAFAIDPDLLTARLDAAGLTEPELGAYLGEDHGALAGRLPVPDWARRLTAILDDARRGERPVPDGHRGFVDLVRPLVEHAQDRVARHVTAALDARPSRHLDRDRLVRAVSAPPTVRIVQHLSKVLVLELNVLRMRGELAGDTPDARFQDFMSRLDDPALAGELLAEYPVLARDLVHLTDNWVAASTAFADHLVADVGGVVHDLLDGRDVVLDSVAFEAGDVHRHGRSVGVLRFDDGSRVVYKPRSLRVDVHFHALVARLNDAGLSPALRTFRVLDRGDHGWSEFVEPAPCPDAAAVQRFYRRQGSYLALLHCLAATDFHFENLIAAGEHPVPVDLEALFHPADEDVPDDLPVPRHATLRMQTSVVGVGLLPMPAFAQEDGSAVDLSGLGSPEGHLSLLALPTWDRVGTDEMTLVRRRLALDGALNRPSVDGVVADVLEHREQLVDGFRDAYRVIMGCRDDLLAADGPLHAFAHDEIRVIVRPTQTYCHLLMEGHHPDLLRDALDRDRFYGFLWSHRRWRSRADDLARAELAQLVEGDVPMFTTTAGSRDVVSGHGTVLPELLARSGLDRVLDRVAGMGEDDLGEQTWFLTGSLTALAMGGDRPEWAGYQVPRARAEASSDQLVEAAARIADRVLDTALVEDDRIAWIGLSLVGEKVWKLGPTGPDAYSGSSGIALFLARAGEVTGDRRYTRAAEMAADDIAARIRDLATVDPGTVPDVGFDIGGFGDIGGPLLLLSHASVLWDRPDLADAACASLPLLAGLAGLDTTHDVIGGAAGCLLVLLALHTATGREDVLDAAGACADRLVAAAEPAGAGRAWRCGINPEAPLAGFSHGASGIAYALSRLDLRRGERRYAALIEDALAFEDGVFDPDHGNWLDLREQAVGAPMVGWCHGAGGIGLARAGMADYLGADRVAVDLDRAVRAVLATGFDDEVITGSGNHSICHGDLGNLEVLHTAAVHTGDAGAAGTVARLARTALDCIAQEGPLCGVPLGVETPGLMAGISGIGYGLLRLARPDVPSVLTLDPPAGR